MRPVVFPIAWSDLEDPERLRSLRRDLEHHYYWSDDWDPRFYRALALQGFISVATEYSDPRWLLLPELQTSYAVLDWSDLTVDRSTRRLLEGPVARNEWILQAGKQLEPILRALEEYHTPSWLVPPYQNLMKRLWNDPRSDFVLQTWELRHRETDFLIGGELGYRIGNVYTSLSGFFDRSTRLWNNAGKVQLALLAGQLERDGVEFWNLGHPTMAYKAALGAQILSRDRFLVRWDAATGVRSQASSG